MGMLPMSIPAMSMPAAGRAVVSAAAPAWWCAWARPIAGHRSDASAAAIPQQATLLAGKLHRRRLDGLHAAAREQLAGQRDLLPGHGLEALVRVRVVVVERHQVERAVRREQAHRHALLETPGRAPGVLVARGGMPQVATHVDDL